MSPTWLFDLSPTGLTPPRIAICKPCVLCNKTDVTVI